MHYICQYIQAKCLTPDSVKLDVGTDGMAWGAYLVYEEGHPKAGEQAFDHNGKAFAHFDACEQGAAGRNGVDVLAKLNAQCGEALHAMAQG